MARDIHKSAFDEGTKAKLFIFQLYLREWLPVFLSAKKIYWNTINICDFFAGPGSDSVGNKGTPLLIKDELNFYHDSIIQKRLNVNLYFNEYKKDKYEALKSALLPDDEDLRSFMIEVGCLDFKEAFEKKLPILKNRNAANLLFLDQSGIKHINEDIFQQIINLKRTDFLFFISSSTIKRFSEHPNIARYIRMDAAQIEKTPYHQIHRLVLEYYRSLIPLNKEYYLTSFSLKKGAGLYGLIFGSSNVLGIEKFLNTCWKIDPERGEANFDIDSDKIIPGQGDLFTGGVRKPKKVEVFENELKEKILDRELKTDKDVYLFTLNNSFTPAHARKLISTLISEKKIGKCKLDLTNKVCKADSKLITIEVL